RDDEVGGVLVAVAGGELGDDVELGVDVEQLVAHGGVDMGREAAGAERRIEDVRFLVENDPDGLRRSLDGERCEEGGEQPGNTHRAAPSSFWLQRVWLEAGWSVAIGIVS